MVAIVSISLTRSRSVGSCECSVCTRAWSSIGDPEREVEDALYTLEDASEADP